MTTITRTHLIAQLKAHAVAHYNEGGWDNLVECYSDGEIDGDLTAAKITTLPEAIAYYADILGAHDEIRQDIEGEAF